MDTTNLLSRLRQSRRKILRPKPKLTLVEWADDNRYLSNESSSMPGRWKTARVEVARGPMLAYTDPTVRQITLVGPTQLFKSSFIENIVGYHIDVDPTSILLVQPTATLAESFGKDRIDKMIRDTPALNGKVKEKKSRDSANTLTYKAFPGGYIALVGSNSPVDLSSRPIRVALMDETDKYPESAGKEGDVPSLVKERTATFFDSKIVMVCSPTIEGRSRITNEYEQGDKRVYHVPCPHCDHAEEMSWSSVRWPDGEPEQALYHCPECSKPWTEPERQTAIKLGFWVATAEFKGHASFRCSKLVSPWETIATLARKWTEALGKPEKLKVFMNTQLAETWTEKGEAPDYQRLYERREEYQINPKPLPEGVAFITVGADVQKDRIEYEVVGWCRDKRSYSIDYRVLMGDTADVAVWSALDKVLNETWKSHDQRELQVRVLAIDSGYNTQHVYNWARKHSGDRVRVIKGSDASQTIFGTPKDIDVNQDGSRLRRAVKLWTIGVSVVKTELYGWLKLDKPEVGKPYPPGYCHFPQYDLEHFKRLCAEQLIKRVIRGRTVYRWEPLANVERNEQLDCRVYARAAAAMFGIDRMSEADFNVLEGKSEVEQTKPEETATRGQAPLEPRTEESKEENFWSRDKRKLF